MAFPTISAQQETNRKILEDLHLKKQLLQKGVSPVVTGIPNLTTNASNSSMPQFIPNSPVQVQQSSTTTTTTDITINSTVRTAFNQANSQSFGFFVPQDSIFGNSILPVLPRFDNVPK